MKILKDMTIRTKITIFNIIIIIMTLYALGYLSNRTYFEHMVKRAVESSYTEMLLINNNLDNLITNMESQARLLSISEGIQEEMGLHTKNEFKRLDIIPEQVTRVYFDIILSNPLSMSASLVTDKNKVLFFGDVEQSSVEVIMDERVIEASKSLIKPKWMGPVEVTMEDGSTHDVFVVVKSIISRYSGEYLGSVFVYVKEKDISNIYLNKLIETNADYKIIDDKDIVVSSVDDSELYQSYADLVGNASAADIPKANNYRIIESEGVSYLQNTYYYEKLDWRIVNTIPLQDITIEINEVTRIIISAGVVCSLIGLFLSAVISRSITKPLSVLAASMKRIRKGELDERIESKRINRSEVGQLSQGFNEMMDDMQSLMADIEVEQEKRRDYEFRLIQSQIKPHFLYNTIETIISCVKLDLKDTALKVAKSLASFYRSSLSRGNEIITVAEEVALTENYLDIQGFRYAEYMTYEVTMEPQINDFMVQKLMLQPIVENAIYHGLKPLEDKGTLSVKGYAQDSDIIFVIRDSGMGMEEKTIARILSDDSNNRDGFGLGSMNQRIKLLYGEAYGISIKSELGSYTEVTIRIPQLTSAAMKNRMEVGL